MYPITTKQPPSPRTRAHSGDGDPQTAHSPHSATLVWAGQGLTPEAIEARREVVRLLSNALTFPSSELNFSHCDPQACLDLPATLIEAHAEACQSLEPPTTRLILPSGLTDVPVWIPEFRTLKELSAHGFIGDANAALTLLKKQCPGLICDLPRTTLHSVYRPYVGTLDESAKAGLRCFMDKLREVVGPTLGLNASDDYHLGGFKVVRSLEGELELLKIAYPPQATLNPTPETEVNLRKTMEVFNTHCEYVRAAVWQAMSTCGYVEYLKAHATSLIDGEWDVLVNIDPYFSRRPTQNVAHKDTLGENMFLMIFHCNDQSVMGLEYQLRPENPPSYSKIMRSQLPSVFVDEVEEVLKEPPDGVAHATAVEPWGFVAGCDELMAHSSPFIHHRGAFQLSLVIRHMGSALKRCFGQRSMSAYMNARVSPSNDWFTDGNAIAQGAHAVVVQLEKMPSSDPWIERSELEKLLHDAKLTSDDAKKLVGTLVTMGATEDPFDGIATIDVPPLNYTAEMKVPSGKALRREMSERLENGTAHPYPQSRDYVRVWIMARRKAA